MILVTILLDCASSVNFITKAALKLVPHKLDGMINASIKTLKGISSERIQSCSVTLKPEKLDQDFTFYCLVIQHITTVRGPFTQAQLPSYMRVDEFDFPQPGKPVDCLLGFVDFFNILISHQKISKNVFLLQICLGSTLAGINSS